MRGCGSWMPLRREILVGRARMAEKGSFVSWIPSCCRKRDERLSGRIHELLFVGFLEEEQVDLL